MKIKHSGNTKLIARPHPALCAGARFRSLRARSLETARFLTFSASAAESLFSYTGETEGFPRPPSDVAALF
jgi:hypothetical protein